MSNIDIQDELVYRPRCSSDIAVDLSNEIASTFSSAYKGNLKRNNVKKWNDSLRELIKWHGQLENKLLLDPEANPKQEYRGLLFTSLLMDDDENLTDDVETLITYLSDVKLKRFYPIYIFNYLSKITLADRARLKRDSVEIIRDQFCIPNTPRFLKLNGTQEVDMDDNKKHSKSMSKLYTETLRTKIKYGFIHAATFFKIMSLPICKESDMQKCLAWYYASYNGKRYNPPYDSDKFNLQRNLDMFLYSPLSSMNNIISSGSKKNILKSLNAIFDELNDINIEADKMYPAYVEYLDKYLKGEQVVDRDKLPVGLARRFDYYTGKYLFELMKVNHKEADLLKLVEVHISADNAAFFKDSYTLYEIEDIEFKSILKGDTYLEDGHVIAPLSVIMLSKFTEDENHKENVVILTGEIKSMKGKLRMGNSEDVINSEKEQVDCSITKLKCTDDSALVIENVRASASKLRNNFIKYPWAIYILVYLLVYDGYKLEYRIIDERAGAKYMG